MLILKTKELLDPDEVDAEWVRLLQEAPLTPDECLNWSEKLKPFIRFLSISLILFYNRMYLFILLNIY